MKTIKTKILSGLIFPAILSLSISGRALPQNEFIGNEEFPGIINMASGEDELRAVAEGSSTYSSIPPPQPGSCPKVKFISLGNCCWEATTMIQNGNYTQFKVVVHSSVPPVVTNSLNLPTWSLLPIFQVSGGFEIIWQGTTYLPSGTTITFGKICLDACKLTSLIAETYFFDFSWVCHKQHKINMNNCGCPTISFIPIANCCWEVWVSSPTTCPDGLKIYLSLSGTSNIPTFTNTSPGWSDVVNSSGTIITMKTTTPGPIPNSKFGIICFNHPTGIIPVNSFFSYDQGATWICDSHVNLLPCLPCPPLIIINQNIICPGCTGGVWKFDYMIILKTNSINCEINDITSAAGTVSWGCTNMCKTMPVTTIQGSLLINGSCISPPSGQITFSIEYKMPNLTVCKQSLPMTLPSCAQVNPCPITVAGKSNNCELVSVSGGPTTYTYDFAIDVTAGCSGFYIPGINANLIDIKPTAGTGTIDMNTLLCTNHTISSTPPYLTFLLCENPNDKGTITGKL